MIYIKVRDGSVGIAIGYGLGFDFPVKQNIFLYSVPSRSSLGSVQSAIQLVPEMLSLEVKQPRREYGHTSPYSAEIKKGGGAPPLPICLHGVMLDYLSAMQITER